MYKIHGKNTINKQLNFMATIHPHINFNGNAEEAFTFYKSVFGGELTKITRFKDVPGFEVAEKEKEKLMSIAYWPNHANGKRCPGIYGQN